MAKFPWIGLAVGAVVVAFTGSALAEDAPVKVPGIMGLGDPQSLGVLAPLGALTEGVKFEVPPGRKGLEPTLALLYNSAGSGRDAGLGWSFELGRIEKGIQTDFVAALSGSNANLVAVGSGVYRAESESTFRQFTHFSDHWEMLDAAGYRFVFGSSTSTRVDGSVWMLDRIQDANGNYLTVDYLNDNGWFYPSAIHYTGHAPTNLAPGNEIDFSYETRTDPRVDYRLGYRRERALLPSAVSMKANGSTARSYDLTYGSVGANSVLTQVTMQGALGTPIAARTYGYSSVQPGWPGPELDDRLPAPLTDTNGADTGTRLVDVNGDTFADVLDNAGHVWLGDGTGNFTPNATWTASLTATGFTFVDSQGRDHGVRLTDVNGDLLPDLLSARQDAPSQVWLNTGSGWTLDTTFSSSLDALSHSGLTTQRFKGNPCNEPGDPMPDPNLPGCDDPTTFDLKLSFVQSSGDSAGVFIADANGDGRADLLWSYQTTSDLFNSDGQTPVFVQAVYLNTGSGWAVDSPLSLAISAVPPFVLNSKPQALDVFDMNGDGLADIVDTASDSSQRAVFLGTGTDWVLDPTYTADLQNSQLFSLDSDNKGQGLMPLDYDGDGLTDLIRADESVVLAYRNTGLGLTEDASFEAELVAQGITFADVDGKGTGFSFADFNGDNHVDIAQYPTGSSNRIVLARTGANGLLIHAATPYGETTDVTYQASSSFVNNDGTKEGLPTVLYVTKTLSRSNGSQLFTKNYTYESGKFEDNQLLGFAHTYVTDERGVIQEFDNRQDEPFQLRPTTVTTFDAGGVMRKRSSTLYANNQPVAGVGQVVTIQTDEEIFDRGTATADKHTRLRYTYDAELNQTQILNDGNVNTTADDTRSQLEFAQNPGASLFSFLSRVTVFDSTNAIVSQNGVLYDNLPFGQVSKGNPTQVFQQIDATHTATMSSSFDAFGNVVGMTDALGHASSAQYDTQSIYRVRTTDALGNVAQTTFDTRFGVPTQSIDPNGAVTTRTFDEFGRLTRETRPGDQTSPFGTRSFEYSALGAGQFIRMHSTETAGQSGTFDITLSYDGFLQLVRAQQEGLAGRDTVVVRTFDETGKIVSESTPFFNGDAAPLKLVQRDALRRPVRETDPSGSFATLTYLGFDVQQLDRRGNLTTTTTDAYDHPTRIAQVLGAQQLATTYTYNGLGNPTQVVDPAGNTTHFSYNLAGWRTQLQDPVRGTTNTTYDLNGHPLSETNALNQTTTYQYDAMAHLTKKTLGTGEVFTYQYGTSGNGANRLVHTGEPAGSTDYTYDARGNITLRKHTVNNVVYLTRYTFDSMDRVRDLRYPDGFFVDYSYGTDGRVTSVTDDKGRVIVNNVKHSPFGALATLSFANGVNSSSTYDTEGKLTEILNASPKQGTFEHETYVYDAGKNIAQINDLLSTPLSQSFQYDALNRLTRAQTDRNSSYGTETYSYDVAGNLQQKGDFLYRYRGANQNLPSCVIDHILAQQDANIPPGSAQDPCVVGPTEDPHAIRGTGDSVHQSMAFRLAYNAEGNMTEKNLRRYRYDSESHLVEVKENSQIWMTNYFDALGNRVRRFTTQADTTYIDSVFETEQGQTRRLINIDGKVVATYASPGRALLESQILSFWKSRDRGVRERFLVELGAVFALLGLLGTAWVMRPKHRIERIWAQLSIEEACAAVARAFMGGKRHWLTAMVAALMQLTLYAPPAHATTRTASYTDDQRFYYHLDQQGTTKFITNFEGMVHARRYYTPFGEQVVPPGMDGSLQNNHSLQGKELDRAQIPELYNFGARAYDPSFGRFMSTDTVVKNAYNPIGLNRLAFGADNPLRFADPSGHSFWDVVAGVFIVVVAVAAAAVISVVTLGAGAPLSAILIGAAIGAVVAGGVAVGLAAEGKINSFWAGASFALIGAIIGASVVGAYLVAGAGAAASGWTQFAYNVLAGALAGGAGGGFTGAAQAVGNGRYDELWQAFGAGYIVGAIVGGIGGVFGDAFTAWANQATVSLSPVWANTLFTVLSAAYGSAASAANYNLKYLNLGAPDGVLNPPS